MEDFERNVTESLARLETSMESLIGNGQPGRIAKIEKTLDSINGQRYWLHGFTFGISAVVSYIISWMKK